MYKIVAAIFFPLVILLIACGPSHKAASGEAKYDSTQLKFAKKLNVNPSEVTNLRLYRFIDEWLGTSYRFGGTDKNGIDCSAFVERLLEEVYDVKLPRTSLQQFFTNHVIKFSATEHLSEGDLVFFKTEKGDATVSHVGLYLKNNLFINAQSKAGVTISDITTNYWKKSFVVAGRVKLL